jgi:hypothetical protein
MGAESRRRAMAHSLDDVVGRYEEIYRLALDGRQTAVPAGG